MILRLLLMFCFLIWIRFRNSTRSRSAQYDGMIFLLVGRRSIFAYYVIYVGQLDHSGFWKVVCILKQKRENQSIKSPNNLISP